MAGTFYVEIVSPDGHVFRGNATRFRGPGVDGSFEVLYDHAPMVVALHIGPIYLTTASGNRIAFATSGGFVEVLNNYVIVLAETAEPASDIDVERARAAESRALKRLQESDRESRRSAEHALERARNRVRVAMATVGSKV